MQKIIINLVEKGLMSPQSRVVLFIIHAFWGDSKFSPTWLVWLLTFFSTTDLWNFCSAINSASSTLPCFTKYLLVFMILVFIQRINATVTTISGTLSLCSSHLYETLPHTKLSSSNSPILRSLKFSVQWDYQNVLGLYFLALWSRKCIQGKILGNHDYPLLRNHSSPLPIVKCLKQASHNLSSFI